MTPLKPNKLILEAAMLGGLFHLGTGMCRLAQMRMRHGFNRLGGVPGVGARSGYCALRRQV